MFSSVRLHHSLDTHDSLVKLCHVVLGLDGDRKDWLETVEQHIIAPLGPIMHASPVILLQLLWLLPLQKWLAQHQFACVCSQQTGVDGESSPSQRIL